MNFYKCICILLPYIDGVYSIICMCTYVCVYLRMCVYMHAVLSRNKFSPTYEVRSSALHTVPTEEQQCNLINCPTSEFRRALHLKEANPSSDVSCYVT
jgi:hypothetical protein